MNSFNTLLFPDTTICKDRLYPLLLFFAPIQILQPVEPAPDNGVRDGCDSFMEHALCQGHTPVPLGKNRERFLHLIKDIRERKDDYSAQLASLTMAAMSATTAHTGGELKHEIVSSLLSAHSVIHSSSDDETALWQSRLILAIAEILDNDEEELTQQLTQLDNQELQMLRSLQGSDHPDEGDPIADLVRMRETIASRRPRNEKKRFEAWLRLMRLSPPDFPLLWLASSQDSADQIINRFEKHSDATAIPVLKLPFPGHIRVSTRYIIEQISQFRKTASVIIEGIKNELDSLARLEGYDPSDDRTLLPGTRDWGEEWQAVLDNHFPASSHGRAHVTIYILPDSPIENLLSFQNNQTPYKHGLLAIARP